MRLLPVECRVRLAVVVFGAELTSVRLDSYSAG